MFVHLCNLFFSGKELRFSLASQKVCDEKAYESVLWGRLHKLQQAAAVGPTWAGEELVLFCPLRWAKPPARRTCWAVVRKDGKSNCVDRLGESVSLPPFTWAKLPLQCGGRTAGFCFYEWFAIWNQNSFIQLPMVIEGSVWGAVALRRTKQIKNLYPYGANILVFPHFYTVFSNLYYCFGFLYYSRGPRLNLNWNLSMADKFGWTCMGNENVTLRQEKAIAWVWPSITWSLEENTSSEYFSVSVSVVLFCFFLPSFHYDCCGERRRRRRL